MRRRTLLTVAAVTLTLGLLALAPGFGPVRDALLRRVTGLLAANGVEVTYDASSGNAWRGVALEGVTIRGRGADIRAERLEVGYFLPSLLGGELPLDVALDEADGTLDLAGLLPEDDTPGGSAPSLRVRPREIDLRGVDVRVVQVPFTLPDMSIEGVRVEEEPGALRFSGTVATAEGSGEVSGRYDLFSGGVTLAIPRADTTLARHWWDGVVAGTASGSMRIDGGRIEGDFELEGGAIDDAGFQASGIAGTVLMRYPVIVADVSANALDGPVRASGTINVANRNYDVSGTASPTLASATAWLARLADPADLPFDVDGDADLELSVTGWDAPVIEGRAAGSGAVAGLPLEDLDARFRVVTGNASGDAAAANGGALDARAADGMGANGGALDVRAAAGEAGEDRPGLRTSIRLDATAAFGGGPVRVSIAPARDGDRLEATATGVDLTGLVVGGFALADLAGTTDEGEASDRGASTATSAAFTARADDVTFELDLGGATTGALRADLQAALPGTPITPLAMSVDGTMDADGWRAFVRGTAAELPFEGAFVLAEDALDGAVNLPEVLLPGLRDPVRASLSATGAWSDLVLGLALDADDPIVLDTPGVLVQADLRGAASGALDLGGSGAAGASGGPAGGAEGAAIRDIRGAFGPMAIRGEMTLAPLALDLAVTLDPTTVVLADAAETALDHVAADGEADGEAGGEVDPATDTLFATAGVPDGRLTYADGRLAWRGRALVSAMTLGPVRLDVDGLDTRFDLPAGTAADAASVGTPADAAADEAAADTVPEASAAVAGSEGGSSGAWYLTAAAPDDRVVLVVDGRTARPVIDATLLDLPVALGGASDAEERLLVSGTVTSRRAPARTAVTRDASAVETTGPRFDVDLRTSPGDVGGVTLAQGASVSGVVDVGASSAALDAAVGAVGTTFDARWSEGPLTVSGILSTPRPDPADGEATLAYVVAPSRGAWSVDGEVDLGVVAAEVGLGDAVRGRFAGSMAHGWDIAARELGAASGDARAAGAPDATLPDPDDAVGYVGDATVRLDAPIVAEASLRGAGSGIDVTVTGDVAGLPLTGGGTITGVTWGQAGAAEAADRATDAGDATVAVDAGDAPVAPDAAAADATRGAGAAVALVADLGPLTGVTLDLDGARGRGVLDGIRAGPVEVAPVPWSLDANWSRTTATLTVAGEDLTVTLVEGEAEVTGELALPFAYAGDVYLLRAGPEGGTQRTADLASMPLVGSVVARTTRAGAAEAPAEDRNAGTPAEEGGTEAPAEVRASLATIDGTARALRIRLLDDEGALAAALPAALRPEARLEGTATFDLLAGPTYRADFAMASTGGTELLRGEAAGIGADVRAEARGDGLEITYERSPDAPEGVLRLLANEAPLAPYLVAVPGGVDAAAAAGGSPGDGESRAGDWFASMDGAMTYDAASGWRGAVRVDASTGSATPDVNGSFTIVGEGERLTLQGDLEAGIGPAESAPAARADVLGTVLPDLSLTGDITAVDDTVQGTYRFTTEEGLVADVRVAAVTTDIASTEPIQATLRWRPDTNDLTLIGDGIDARWSEGRLAGGATVPLTIMGRATPAEVTLAGTLEDPTVRAEVVADLHLASATAPFLDGPVTATAVWSGSSGWTADLAAPLVAADGPLLLRGSVDGSGTAYEGAVALVEPAVGEAPPRVVAEAPLRGTGGDASLTLDLGTVAWSALGRSLGVEIDLRGSGTATFTTRPAAATLEADLAGTIAGTDVRLTGSAPDDLRLEIDGAAGKLDGRLAWTAERTAELHGTLDGRAVDLTLALDEDLRSGHLDAAVGDARIRAVLAPVEAAVAPGTPGAPERRLEVTTDVPSGTIGRPGGTARAVVTFGGATSGSPAVVELTTLEARLDGMLGPQGESAEAWPVLLDAEGSLSPTLDLRGSVRVPTLGEAADLEVRGEPAVVDLRWDGLRARFDTATSEVTFTGGTAIDTGGTHATAYATLLPPALHGAALDLSDVNLRWSPVDGFEGSAGATLAVPAWERLGDLDVRLAGDGGLAIDAGIFRAGSEAPWAGLSARLGPDPFRDPTLSGNLILDAPLDAVVTTAGLPDVRLTGRPELGGTLGEPTLAGDIALEGAITATGTVAYDGGSARLALAGNEVTATAEWRAGRWEAQGGLDGLDLQAWAPFLADPRLSLTARAGSSDAGPFVVHLDDVALTTNRSSLTGAATVGDGVRAALQAQVDLADLRLGDTELRGLLRGPVVLAAASTADLSSASVTAMLDAARVGVAGFDGSVSGSLQLGGSVADPFLTTALIGDGAVRGSVRLDAAPTQGRLDLSSDLTIGSFASDLRISVQEGTATARGAARLGEAVVLFDDDEDGIRATGVGRLDGWTARIAPDLSAADVTGDLATAARGAHGTVSLTFRSIGSDAGIPWLSGTVTDAAVLDQPLGTLQLTSASPGAVLTVTGDHLDATLDPGALGWRLDIDDLPTTLGPSVTLRGEGSGAAFEVEGTLNGAAEGAPLPLDVAFRYQRGDRTELEVHGRVADGTIDAVAHRQGTAPWQGGARLQDANLGGFTLDADGAAQGTGLLPQLVLRTTATGPLHAAGRATVGISGATIDQTIEGAPLGGPLRVQGRLLPHTDLTIAGASGLPVIAAVGGEPGASSESRQGALGSAGTLRLRGDGTATGALHAVGAIDVTIGPARVRLEGRGANGTPYLRATLPALPGLGAETDLAASNLADLVQGIAADGLVLAGTGGASGTVTLRASPGLVVEIDALRAEALGFLLTADGTLTSTTADVRGALALPPGLPVEDVLPWRATLEEGRWSLVSDGALGTIEASFDADGGLALDVDADIGGGKIEGRAALVPGVGLDGSLVVSSVHVAPTGLGVLTLDADATIADGRVGGRASIDMAGGRISASGSWGLRDLLPAALAPGAAGGGSVELRARTLELAEVPVVNDLLPHLQGAISGVVQLRDGLVLGQVLVPELRVGERTLPTTLSLSGSPTALDASLSLGRSLVTADFDGRAVAGTARLEMLPLDLLAEAAVGETDVTAELTGVLRFDVPLAAPASGYARIASERILLERAGVVTTGDVTITYLDRTVTVDRAEFEGLGAWQAGGVVGPDLLDFRLDATDADFTPLLGLVPSLARLGVGARGSFTFAAGGSLAAPTAEFVSDDLGVRVAGGAYRLTDTHIGLDGVALSGATRLSAGGAVTGALDVTAGARLVLLPLALNDLDVRLQGEAGARGIGTVTDIQGVIRQQDGTPWLDLAGNLGSALRVEGSLAPLDLRAGGTDLTIAFPSLLVASAVVDADLRMMTQPAGLSLGGTILADEVVIDPAARAGGDAEDAVPDDADGAVPSPEPQASEPEAAPESGQDAGAVLRFDGLAIRAPQRVLLSTNLGSGEAALDLVLSGSSADPQLSGEASALRGNLRFSGRDFTIERAVATFRPNRGVLPDLDVAAYAEFDKQRSLSGLPDVRFVEPSEGASFRVDLAFAGPVQSAPPEQGSFRFDVRPMLSSEALIEVQGEGVGAGVRPLTQPELLSLITLGRLELNADVIGSGGLGEAVAQGALDTAVDLLIVSELQNALREALGLDVVEIRTSTISSLLDVDAPPFGVSVRLGGYLVPELFASYRIGTYDGTDRAYAVTNEVLLSYALGPLDLDLFGRLDFPTAGTLAPPRPELGVGVSYAFGRSLRLETGVSLATDRSAVHFGVTLRW